MDKVETMSLDEKLDIGLRAFELLDAGDEDGYMRLSKTIPLPPYLAMSAKRTMGVDFLINGGWNLSEAEAEFGADWLNK
ncbi:MAG: hypothetical protein LBI42_10290 [Chitinispirillales bacterium]|nr:hypothetical protein [Chitinispirillales bacterium]